ncbi:FkbM family methyltransferase [Parasphingorhabdus sp.]|uniref:FkbM family methyltransferase n=1 Tax=Parasphingorhabdus sp. TaxID=2709688 RepID=UPI0030019F86
MKQFLKKILAEFDLAVTRRSTLDLLYENISEIDDNDFLQAIEPRLRSNCIDVIKDSKAQLRQDLFVLSELGFRKGGFFVEFGATNGINLSNTYLLEKKFGWTGILAEPAKFWHSELENNRNAKIDKRCVWRVSGEQLVFNETSDRELSTIDLFSLKDDHSRSRSSGKKYKVETITLSDLLEFNSAPHKIDYLSIDTEGSELDILANFDFSRYEIKIITCEHNYTNNREKINNLLLENGFVRKFENISKFDDWFVNMSLQKDTA